ncbi:MAG: type I restriction enzyme HsdR N-terminal domain-containing protein [Desulfobacteraceae bacterium]|nr:type I restriction enzyme HsdR N-terminal domain-containing protein [Desulfobacteraceae bacterium]
MNNCPDMLTDYITGNQIPNAGAEANRQAIEHILVKDKGFAKTDIEVDAPIRLDMDDGLYVSRVDLVVSVREKRILVVKCAAGSLDSRQREIIAAARVLDSCQIPLAAASNGLDAYVWDTLTGRLMGRGIAFIPTIEQALEIANESRFVPLAEKLRKRQQLIFRSYDSENIN